MSSSLLPKPDSNHCCYVKNSQEETKPQERRTNFLAACRQQQVDNKLSLLAAMHDLYDQCHSVAMTIQPFLVPLNPVKIVSWKYRKIEGNTQVLSYYHKTTRAIFIGVVSRKTLKLHHLLDGITCTHMIEKFAVFGSPSYLHHSRSNDCNLIVPNSRIDTECTSNAFKGGRITSSLPKPNQKLSFYKISIQKSPFLPWIKFLAYKNTPT